MELGKIIAIPIWDFIEPGLALNYPIYDEVGVDETHRTAEIETKIQAVQAVCFERQPTNKIQVDTAVINFSVINYCSKPDGVLLKIFEDFENASTRTLAEQNLKQDENLALPENKGWLGLISTAFKGIGEGFSYSGITECLGYKQIGAMTTLVSLKPNIKRDGPKGTLYAGLPLIIKAVTHPVWILTVDIHQVVKQGICHENIIKFLGT